MTVFNIFFALGMTMSSEGPVTSKNYLFTVFLIAHPFFHLFTSIQYKQNIIFRIVNRYNAILAGNICTGLFSQTQCKVKIILTDRKSVYTYIHFNIWWFLCCSAFGTLWHSGMNRNHHSVALVWEIKCISYCFLRPHNWHMNDLESKNRVLKSLILAKAVPLTTPVHLCE